MLRKPLWLRGKPNKLWQRGLLAAVGTLYLAGAELSPFDRVDAWIDARLFWEPVGLAGLLLVLVLLGDERHSARWFERRPGGAGEEESELVPICGACKAVQGEGGSWTPIEAYLVQRTSGTFTRSLCSGCLSRLARP